ncbi:hypothetical protein [Rubripirellula reticaptiva]|uniref:Uncharacterized protein n=1 Tax=Rubripirellula reticaptiva TaxID=2528013 RepID=A0A5C6EIV5_9BACT|nr:hypothetical protein [Rubripirellula reticaptiva]TWU48385.1 hypothetical protein Poly59_52320 [Rubripirellula reticaptiva]
MDRPLIESKRSIVLDIEFVNIDVATADADSAASLWQWVDETPIDINLRNEFLNNGIRIGLVSSEERFRERITSLAAQKDVLEEFLTSASVASDLSRGEKRIPMRIGKRYELPVRQPIEGNHVALARVGQQTIGRTLQNAQYLMAIRPVQATGQKQIELSLRTEIQHGETQQKWVGSDSAIRIDQRRETWPIPSLDLNLEVAEGDVLVLAPTWPLTGLAKHMFSGQNADHQPEMVVLLIRVAQVPTAIDRI